MAQPGRERYHDNSRVQLRSPSGMPTGHSRQTVQRYCAGGRPRVLKADQHPARGVHITFQCRNRMYPERPQSWPRTAQRVGSETGRQRTQAMQSPANPRGHRNRNVPASLQPRLPSEAPAKLKHSEKQDAIQTNGTPRIFALWQRKHRNSRNFQA